MERYFFVWAFCGIVSTLLLGVGAFECTDKESLLRETPGMLTLPSSCLMECTGLTYARKLGLQDTRTIRLKDSTQGDLGAYCWSMHLQCVPGESLQHAYVVLPVDENVAGQQRLELQAAGTSLHLHHGRTTLAQDCGLRYDVTLQFNTGQTGPLFCVQIVTDPPGDLVLRCPPYLATIWQRNLS